MSKDIRFSLSYDSVVSALKQIQAYRDSLDDKMRTFTERLSKEGIKVIEQIIPNTRADYIDTSHYTELVMSGTGGIYRAKIEVSGNAIAFIEFGTGVHYNGSAGSSPHPLGEELGMTIGSYGQHHGEQDSWTFETDSGEWVRTQGIEASMPLYNASMKMREKNVITQIAREVFGGM